MQDLLHHKKFSALIIHNQQDAIKYNATTELMLAYFSTVLSDDTENENGVPAIKSHPSILRAMQPTIIIKASCCDNLQIVRENPRSSFLGFNIKSLQSKLMNDQITIIAL